MKREEARVARRAAAREAFLVADARLREATAAYWRAPTPENATALDEAHAAKRKAAVRALRW